MTAEYEETGVALPRILVIDDEPAILSLLKRYFERHGLVMEMAETGRSGLERFRADGDPIDCVIVDRKLPGLDGLAVATEIRALRPDCPIILTSGSSDDEIDAFCSVKHVVFAPKPFELQGLVALVHSLLA